MSKTINRRGFVKASFFGLGAFALAQLPFGASAQNVPANSNSYTHVETLALYRQARELFFQKQYAASIAIFERLIAAFPSRIEYYDGYAKVLNAQQKSLETAELYIKGADKNPENPYFKQRLSLSIRRMAAGNLKDAAVYQSRYDVSDLWQHSSELLVAALAIKPTSNEFKLNLRDLPNVVERKNRANSKRRHELISLSEESVNNIDNLTLSVSGRWTTTRFVQPKTFGDSEAIDRSVERLRNKPRRNLNNSREQKLREESKRDSIKERWNVALDNAIARNVPGQVDKYGLKIVNEMPDCTNTVGKLRDFYRGQNSVNRLITLNRVLYANNDNVPNALSLATSLLRHNNGNGILPECRQLVSPISEYAHILPSVYAVTYYFVRSQIHIREGRVADARDILLTGIQRFDGRGGRAYSLMENYALTFPRQQAAEGVRIMEALCGRGFDDKMDSRIQPYVKNYVENTDFDTLHLGERIKKLRALARMQRLQGGNAQRATETEIAALQRELREQRNA